MTDTVLAQLAALKTTPTPQLREQWRSLFAREPPLFNRKYLESRLAYRIQELHHGGLKPETIKRLEALAKQFVETDPAKRRARPNSKPVSGTRLIREWKGTEHVVTVRDDGYEWQGRPYKSLSPIANAITGSRWNGYVFFGLKHQRGRG